MTINLKPFNRNKREAIEAACAACEITLLQWVALDACRSAIFMHKPDQLPKQLYRHIRIDDGYYYGPGIHVPEATAEALSAAVHAILDMKLVGEVDADILQKIRLERSAYDNEWEKYGSSD